MVQYSICLDTNCFADYYRSHYNFNYNFPSSIAIPIPIKLPIMPLIMGIAISLRKKIILSNINFTFFHYPKNFRLRRTGAYPKKAIISPSINNVSHVMLFLEKMQTIIDNSSKPVPAKQHINCNISSHLFLFRLNCWKELLKNHILIFHL